MAAYCMLRSPRVIPSNNPASDREKKRLIRLLRVSNSWAIATQEMGADGVPEETQFDLAVSRWPRGLDMSEMRAAFISGSYNEETCLLDTSGDYEMLPMTANGALDNVTTYRST